MNLDRLREDYLNNSFPDPQNRRVHAYCDYDGKEIYEGELCVLTNDGRYVRYDIDVLVEYIGGRVITAGEEDV